MSEALTSAPLPLAGEGAAKRRVRVRPYSDPYLTGGALLSVGSWLFMIAAFAGAYALAPLLRKAWR